MSSPPLSALSATELGRMIGTKQISPFPWHQLYLGEPEGETLKNYYHWLALTYVVTLVTNPSIALPCGVDEHAMPLERAFAGITGLGRPVPDVQTLSAPRPELKSMVTAAPLIDTAD